MTQESQTMTIQARKTGKGPSGQYRQQRQVPAVIYGPKTKNMNCMVEEIFVLKHSGSKHESAIFQTASDDKALSGMKVMIKKIDTHPGSNRPVHVDLYALDMTAKIKVNVTIEFEGTAAGTKEGGVFNSTRREVEVECNPTEIPETIKVDVSSLQLNASLHVSDIQFPAGVVPVSALDLTICTVSVPKEETAEAEGAAEGEAKEAAPAGGSKE